MGVQINPAINYASDPLLPVMLPGAKQAVEYPVNLAPLTTFTKGTVMAQVGTAGTNDVQTITAPGSGNYKLTFTNPLTGNSAQTANIAFGANDATVLAALQPIVTSTGGGTAAVSSLAVTFSGLLASRPVPLMTTTAGSVAHTTTGRTANTWAAYNDSNSDGTQTARGIMKYTCTTDASGNVSYSTSSNGGPWGETSAYGQVYISGYFNTAQLTGLDANGVADFGRLINGTTTAGILNVY